MSEPSTITRREALRQVTAMLGGVALTGSAGLLGTMVSGDARARMALAMDSDFSMEDIAWLDTMADTVLPETSSPGASAAAVGAFLALMVTDTYNPAEQAVFRAGMRSIEDHALQQYGQGFEALDKDTQLAILTQFDREQHAFQDAKDDDDLPHFFRMMKELTVLGYFTSEIGCTQALRYIESPGRYDPCYPIAPGEKYWAPT